MSSLLIYKRVAAYLEVLEESSGIGKLFLVSSSTPALPSRIKRVFYMSSEGSNLLHEVNQGLTVYGNKGSTDQHTYIQQLREGMHNFFVTFIEVLRDRPPGHDWELEPGVTCGDYPFGMLQI